MTSTNKSTTSYTIRFRGYRNLGLTTSLTVRFFASIAEANKYAANHERPFDRIVLNKIDC